jgi:hypothetical protein
VDGITRKEAHGMALKRRIVVVDWVDGDVSDSDEVVVVCQDDETAISRAKAKWRMTIGAEWPHCRIQKVEVLTPARLRGFA